MKKGGVGGGSTVTGLAFESRVDLKTMLSHLEGYHIEPMPSKGGTKVFFGHQHVATLFQKQEFYRFLESKQVRWQSLISKKLLPDDSLLVIVRETLFIIEVKFQQVAGSVDEKLQTCDFKRKQYIKLVHPLGLRVEYVYVLNDWFKDPRYKDTLEYIHSVNCHYKFNELPLAWLGLPSGGQC